MRQRALLATPVDESGPRGQADTGPACEMLPAIFGQQATELVTQRDAFAHTPLAQAVQRLNILLSLALDRHTVHLGSIQRFGDGQRVVVIVLVTAPVAFHMLDVCQRLQTIPGFGPVVASAFSSHVANGEGYRRGRDVSASIGLVPRQHSSGGKQVLLGISKRGDRYLRCLLIQGARAVVYQAPHKDDPLSRWINRISDRGLTCFVIDYHSTFAILDSERCVLLAPLLQSY